MNTTLTVSDAKGLEGLLFELVVGSQPVYDELSVECQEKPAGHAFIRVLCNILQHRRCPRQVILDSCIIASEFVELIFTSLRRVACPVTSVELSDASQHTDQIMRTINSILSTERLRDSTDTVRVNYDALHLPTRLEMQAVYEKGDRQMPEWGTDTAVWHHVLSKYDVRCAKACNVLNVDGTTLAITNVYTKTVVDAPLTNNAVRNLLGRVPELMATVAQCAATFGCSTGKPHRWHAVHVPANKKHSITKGDVLLVALDVTERGAKKTGLTAYKTCSQRAHTIHPAEHTRKFLYCVYEETGAIVVSRDDDEEPDPLPIEESFEDKYLVHELKNDNKVQEQLDNHENHPRQLHHQVRVNRELWQNIPIVTEESDPTFTEKRDTKFAVKKVNVGLLAKLLAHERGPWSLNMGEWYMRPEEENILMTAIEGSRVSFIYIDSAKKDEWKEIIRTNRTRIENNYPYRVPWNIVTERVVCSDNAKLSTYGDIVANATQKVNEFIQHEAKAKRIPRKTWFNPAKNAYNTVCIDLLNRPEIDVRWHRRVINTDTDAEQRAQICNSIAVKRIGGNATCTGTRVITLKPKDDTSHDVNTTSADLTLFVPLTVDNVYGTKKIKRSTTTFGGVPINQFGSIVVVGKNVTYFDRPHTGTKVREYHVYEYTSKGPPLINFNFNNPYAVDLVGAWLLAGAIDGDSNLPRFPSGAKDITDVTFNNVKNFVDNQRTAS
jgi:hypothetical protein